MQNKYQVVELKGGPEDGLIFTGPTVTLPDGEITARVYCPRRSEYWLLYRGQETFANEFGVFRPVLDFIDWMPSNLHPSKAK